MCEQFLIDVQRLFPRDITCLHAAVAYQLERARESCLSIIRKNFELVPAKELLNLDVPLLTALLGSEECVVVSDEFSIFQMLVPWFQRCYNGKDFMDVVNCIRFLFMSAQQLQEVASSETMRRVHLFNPEYLADVLETRALYRESFVTELPRPVPRPRLYLNLLNDKVDVFGTKTSRYTRRSDRDKNGFVNLSFDANTLKNSFDLENILIEGERATDVATDEDRALYYRLSPRTRFLISLWK